MTTNIPDHVRDNRENYVVLPDDTEDLMQIVYEELNFLEADMGEAWVREQAQHWVDAYNSLPKKHAHTDDIRINVRAQIPRYLLQCIHKLLDEAGI